MNDMTRTEILERLCYYDPRNPDYNGEEKGDGKCYCDNCFYGRTVLANELLKLTDKIERYEHKRKQ